MTQYWRSYPLDTIKLGLSEAQDLRECVSFLERTARWMRRMQDSGVRIQAIRDGCILLMTESEETAKDFGFRTDFPQNFFSLVVNEEPSEDKK